MELDNLTPEQIDLILGAGEDDPMFAEAAQKQKLADAMRQQAMGRIEGQQLGKIYHAGSALEGAAKVFQAYKAGGMMDEANQMNQQAQGRVVDSRRTYGRAMIDALRRRNNPGMAPGMSMTDPSTGSGADDFGGGTTQGMY